MPYCRIFALRIACNFLMASHICFRYWEFWSLGGNIKVILSSFTFLREARATS